MIVIKRNGNVTSFDKDKITSAIRRAMVECNVPTSSAERVSNEVVKELEGEYIHIEDIQDEVENCLMQMGFNDVAKAYILYRSERTRMRNKHPLDESILGLIDMTNTEVLTENSNKQSQLASTQRDLIAGEVSKYISRTRLIPKDIMDAHDKGIIKIHDLDYYLQPLTNCELVPLDDMFENGTVINKKLIRKPKSLRTATTLATQVAAQVSSFSFGGQTMTLSHLAPYVRISENKIRREVISEGLENGLNYTKEQIESITQKRLQSEIKDSVQTFNYQLSTLNSVNGQSPFLSLAMYINENPEYEKETAMLIEEFLKQRIEGMENEFGIKSTQTFPKLLFFLDEDNMYPTSKYYYLKQLAIKSASLRMNPDFISVKVMKRIHGHAFPCINIACA